MPNNRWAVAAAGLGLSFLSSFLQAAPGTFVRAGVPYLIEVWDEGLVQQAVIAMTQTRDGYLWLGTLNGLVRFDGDRFTVFDKSNTPGLKSSRIIMLFEDSRETLWIGTETAGVAKVEDGRITTLDVGRDGREGRLAAICEDSAGAVWLYMADGQLWRYHNGKTNGYSFGTDRFSVDRFRASRAIIAENPGRVWVGTDGRMSAIPAAGVFGSGELPKEEELRIGKLDFLLASKRGGYWRLADGRVQKWMTNQLAQDWGFYPWGGTNVLAACEDGEGNLIVGTHGAGLFWFDSDGKSICVSTNEGLSHNIVLSLQVDREGSLWVGTDGGGLNRLKRQVFEVLEPTRGQVVQSVSEDEERGLWIGYNGGGVDRWREGDLQRFGASQGLMGLPVRAVFADQEQVWVGTLGAGLFRFQVGQIQRLAGVGAVHPRVLAIHQDRRRRLWVGTEGGLASWDGPRRKVFTTRDGLSSDVVRAIADDTNGNIWVGTVGGGLNRLSDDQFTSFDRKADLAAEDISSLLIDNEGVLWIGTDGGGLARLHNGRLTRYTTRDGLISNSVGYLIEDEQGYLWVGSNFGLMRISKRALNDFALGLTPLVACRAYGKPDGMPTRECTLGSQPGACRSRDGKLWFPTIRGLASVDPARLHLNTNPPPVIIESVMIEGREQNTNGLRGKCIQPLIVPPGQKRLEIRYTSLNLAARDRARFRYRLEGHDTAWTEAGQIDTAIYPKLPPGEFTFQVTACNEDSVWNEKGAALAIIVKPPFWRTWWFLTAAAIGIVGGMTAVVYYVSTQKLQRQLEGLRQREAIEKDRARIARDIHDQVGASLTQVSLLGELLEGDKHSPDEVEAHARQITQTARETTRSLDEIVWTVNPSNDTLDGLVTYVCKYAQEYLAVAGLSYRLDVPAQLPAAVISPEVRHNVFLAAKEAITNVVRHAQASSVSLRLKLKASAFTLEIEDNGRGLAGMDENRAQSRNGLRNMGKRMENIGGSFAIESAPGGGTRVLLTAPIGNH